MDDISNKTNTFKYFVISVLPVADERVEKIFDKFEEKQAAVEAKTVEWRDNDRARYRCARKCESRYGIYSSL